MCQTIPIFLMTTTVQLANFICYYDVSEIIIFTLFSVFYIVLWQKMFVWMHESKNVLSLCYDNNGPALKFKRHYLLEVCILVSLEFKN